MKAATTSRFHSSISEASRQRSASRRSMSSSRRSIREGRLAMDKSVGTAPDGHLRRVAPSDGGGKLDCPWSGRGASILLPARRARAGRCARRQRDHRERSRPARLRRPRGGAGLPRRRAAADDPFLLGDMEAAVERIRAAVADGRRICVHGDYDADGICATVLAITDPARARRGRGVAPAEPLRRGLRRLERHDRAARRRGLRARPHRRLRDHGRGRGRRGARPRPRRDRDRPPPAGRDAARTARSSRRAPSTYPFPELCGTGVVFKLGQALLGADAPELRRHLDLVALATIADVVPLVGENRVARDRRPARARADAEAGPAGADARRPRRSGDRRRRRGRLPARAADQRRRPARPSRRGAGAPAHRRPRGGGAARATGSRS